MRSDAMECVIFIGIQASGKSTFYQQHFFYSHTHISLDVLKNRQRQRHFIDLCLETQQRFVIDNTNFNQDERTEYIAWAKQKKFKVIAYFFEPNFDRSMAYNQQRTGKRCVPDVAIKSTIKKLEAPHMAEGFDQIFYVSHDVDGKFIAKEQI